MEIDADRDHSVEGTSTMTTTEVPVVGLRESIISHLSGCEDIHFKSQQLGEPELSVSEKRSILEEVLNRSHGTFLSRFGHRLLPEHLSYFDSPADEESYEVQFYLSRFKGRKVSAICDVQVKNRRFQAMKKLMSEGEYFSVGEMRKRNPLLFEQLLGNFIKDPKMELNHEQEYQIAHILLDQMEQDQIAALQKSQLEVEMEQAEEWSSSDEAPDDDEGYSTKDTAKSAVLTGDVVNHRALWGNSYKSDHVIGRSRWKNRHCGKECTVNSEADLNQDEKSLLINEFTSSMFNSFLQGKDEFDYSEVDNNPDYDDINQREIDEQEKYFDSESPKAFQDGDEESQEDSELDRLYQSLSEEIKSEKLANEFRHMNTDEGSSSRGCS